MGILDLPIDPLTGAVSPSADQQTTFARIVNALSGEAGKLGNAVFRGIPSAPVQYNPIADWVRSSAMPSSTEAAFGVMGGPRLGGLGGVLRPYQGVPDSLMGFKRNGPNVPFSEQNWSHTQPVRVTFPERNGLPADTFEDAVRGLNQAHALERARRNWPGATVEAIE